MAAYIVVDNLNVQSDPTPFLTFYIFINNGTRI
jgi:hypothetical protein